MTNDNRGDSVRQTDDLPYELCVERRFIAQHFLTVPDAGPEGDVHSHRFRVELRFASEGLNEDGYLLDIDRIHDLLDEVEHRYGNTLLNDLPEFDGVNPSVERFAKAVGDRVSDPAVASQADRLTVRIWEDDQAWASHRRWLG